MQESRRKRKKELLDLERPVRKKNREPEAMLTVSDVDWTSELTTTLWTKLKTCHHFIVSFPKYITVNSLNRKKAVAFCNHLSTTKINLIKIAKEEVHSRIFLAQSWHVSEYLSLFIFSLFNKWQLEKYHFAVSVRSVRGHVNYQFQRCGLKFKLIFCYCYFISLKRKQAFSDFSLV